MHNQTARRTRRAGAELQMTNPITLEEMARQAIDGDREALEGLVRVLQADIYGLSLRML